MIRLSLPSKLIQSCFILLIVGFGGCAPRKLPSDLDQNAHLRYWKPTKYRQGWWYATGLFEDSTGKEYFHQFTIFHAKRPLFKAYASHQSISNPAENNHLFTEKIYIDGKGSGCNDTAIWVGRDTIIQTINGYRLIGNPPGKRVVVDLKIEKPLVLHGNAGVISMGHGNKPKQQSVYYSHTKLSATGFVITPFDSIPITGTYWFDRQFGPFTELHWYWYSVRMDDGTERMLFYFPNTGEQLYEEIDINGLVTRQKCSVNSTDTSEVEGELFPLSTSIQTKSEGYELTPLSEHHFNPNRVGPLYWEGPCYVVNEQNDTIGHAVVEITGKEAPKR